MMKKVVVSLLLSGSLGAFAMGPIDSKTSLGFVEDFREEGALMPLTSGGLALPNFTVRLSPTEAFIEMGGSISAPCTKTFVRLEPADPADIEEHTYAVYNLEAQLIQGLPPFHLDNFIDKEHPLPHQREVLSRTENDQELRTEYLQRVFVLVGEDQYDLRKETVFASYSFTEREEDRWNAAHRFMVREYKRGDGSIFLQDIASFPHQTRILSFRDDDKSLSTLKQRETFAIIAGQHRSIKTEEVVEPYPFTDLEEDRRSQRLYALVRKYTRSDKSVFSRDTQTFPYQERCVRTIEDDNALATKRTVETFVTWGTPQKVLMTEVRSVLYPFTEREDNRPAQRLLAVVRDYKRSNGSVFPKDYQTFPYQERCVQTIEDDNALVTKRTFETFVTRGPRVIKTEIRPTPYSFTEREDHRAAQRTVVLVRDYKRGNGSGFSRDHQAFPYKERCVGTIEDDNALATKRTYEFYVDRNPHIVRGKEVRGTPYPYTDQSKTTEDWRPRRVYGQNWNVRTYTRSNRSTFSREWKVGGEYVIRDRGWWVAHVLN
ncbi:MAG: hypothetical protein LBF76_02590 [Holosporales bacterium]|jgi:hypothetical protein|nr:hypothetical protein [Holosporales bacterium]